jgi:hypothetical protein
VSTEVEAKFLDAVAAEDFEVVNLMSADFARWLSWCEVTTTWRWARWTPR